MDPRVGLLGSTNLPRDRDLAPLTLKALDLRRRLLSRAQLLHRGPARRKSGEHDAMGAVEPDEGFCYSIGLLVKAQRLGLRIGEVPALRLERKQGTSRFRVLKIALGVSPLVFYAFATTWLRRPRKRSFSKL
jgi:hypothetical protein